jgi:probable addiction module antidote protein
MADGDDDEFLRALGHVAKARGMSQLAKDAGVGRESLYKALKPGATPGYATVGKVVRALGFRMVVEPVTRQKAAAAAKKPAKPKTSVAVAAAKKAKSAAAGAARLKGTRARA